MKQLLTVLVCLVFGLSCQAQTATNALLGKWETSRIRESNVINGKKNVEEYNYEGERLYNFVSDKVCYITTGYSDVKHPHTYVIKGDKIIFTMEPMHLRKIKSSEDEYGIELETTSWYFKIDTDKKLLYFSNTTKDGNDSYQSIITFKKVKKVK